MVDQVELIARIGRPPSRRLTVISAPAGYGKSTLARRWYDSLDDTVPSAWVSTGDCRDDVELRTRILDALDSLRSEARPS